MSLSASLKTMTLGIDYSQHNIKNARHCPQCRSLLSVALKFMGVVMLNVVSFNVVAPSRGIHHKTFLKHFLFFYQFLYIKTDKEITNFLQSDRGRGMRYHKTDREF